MNNLFPIEGVIRHNPIRNGIKSNSNIMILEIDCSDELDKHYQWFVFNKYGIKLSSPMFGLHVSVIRPEEVDVNHLLWGTYENHKITAFYSDLERHWEFWSLNIYSKDLVQIREAFGLNPFFRLHMTIGRQEKWDNLPIIPNLKHDTDFLDYKPI